MLKIGIVGLPNVGKSTLFNALLKKSSFAEASAGQAGGAKVGNFPFTTIDPNVGVVAVPDDRLQQLAEVIGNSPPIVPAVVEFYDIAGLVAGASKGEGLGNKFLSHIKEVDAIVHVVRLFDDKEILRTGVSPENDIEVVETELILKDLETLSRQARPHKKLEKEEVLFYDTVDLLRQKLDEGVPVGRISLDKAQKEVIKPLNLLTAKPVLYVFNQSETQIAENVIARSETTKQSQTGLPRFARNDNSLYLCAKLESDIVSLSESEQAEYLKEYGLEEPGLNRLIKAGYQMLGLISFLTAGAKEVRAWTIRKGTLAPQAAAVIHTDFERHFIKAEIAKFDDFVSLVGWQKCRDAGKVILGGRDYVMRDGDVVDFKVGV